MSGCSAIISSRASKPMTTLNEPGSADLWMGTAVKMRPRTRNTGVPHAVPSSVFGSASPISRTSSNDSPFAFTAASRERVDVSALAFEARAVVLREPGNAFEDRVGVEVRLGDDVGLETAAQPVVVEIRSHRIFVRERADVAQ